MTPISECKTVEELLGDKSRWTQGYFAKDANGNDVEADSLEACCFCVLGAIERLHGFATTGYHKAKYKLNPIVGNIDIFNDTHTYEEVMEKVREAKI